MPLPEYKQLVDEAKREIKEIGPAELKGMQQSKQNFFRLAPNDYSPVAKRDRRVVKGVLSIGASVLQVAFV